MRIGNVRYIRVGTAKIPLSEACRKSSARMAVVMGGIGALLALAELLSIGTGLSWEGHIWFCTLTVLFLGLGWILARDAIRGYITTKTYRQAGPSEG
jgi:hypothetical protein